MRCLAVVAMLLTTSVVRSQEPAKVTLLPGPAQAQAAALADASKLTPFDRQFVRYLWIPQGTNTPSHIKVVSFTLNWISNATTISRPPVFGGQKLPEGGYSPAIVRVDLRRYAPRPNDLERWINTWERLELDPSFNRLITSDTIKLLAETLAEVPFGVTKIEKDGTLVVRQADGTTKNVNVVRSPAPYLQPVIRAKLEQDLRTFAPVVRWDYFVMRALASIEDAGLFTDLLGGLYYQFIGVRKAKEAGFKKASDLDVLFLDLGIVDDADKGGAQAKLDRLASDQRVAMLRSNVTGKVRAVYILPTLSSVRHRGIVFLTMDVKDQNIDLLKNVFANLLDLKPDAMEVIWVAANGSQRYALFNAQGALQQEVPPDIAIDHTIPTPYTKRLQVTGCITCHGAKLLDGWQPIPNEVQLTRKGLDIITDISDRNKAVPEILELLAAKYGGNADGTLTELRRGLIASVLQMTGPWPDDKDQTGVYGLTSGAIDKLRQAYWYEPITAKTVLEEIGVEHGKTDPLTVLRDLLPPDPLSRNDLLRLIPEDVRVGQLLSGRGISRAHFALVEGFIRTRVNQTYNTRLKGKP